MIAQQESTTPDHFVPASRIQGFGATVFAEYTALAIEHNAVNLGQGFPNFAAPDFVKQAAQDAIAEDLNQYTRYAGHPRLVNALSQVYSPLFGREIDPMTEIVTTVGATEGIFATIQALIQPGDEVILFEPFYDSYPASVIMAGGTPIYVPLRPPAPDNLGKAAEWSVDPDELAAAFSERTRLVIVNNPQNALGKIYSRAELEMIAQLVQQHDAYVLADEVYEWMVYPEEISGDEAGSQAVTLSNLHTRIATLPGMWERTITLGSAGKTFSVTGWKIGWAITPAPIAHAILMGHQWIPFTIATPLQEAVAVGMERAKEEGYFEWLSSMYQAKRDKLMAVLADVGIAPVKPDGSYFILADSSSLDVPNEEGILRDVSACRWLTKEIGVAAIPPSHFYSPANQHLTENLVRFCFCKTDDMLDEAAERLYAKFK
ncbi:MAG: aminotransferase class I/II-fold pyridoxal phosphate-dependent enzyme [Chloroflexota bacterium]